MWDLGSLIRDQTQVPLHEQLRVLTTDSIGSLSIVFRDYSLAVVWSSFLKVSVSLDSARRIRTGDPCSTTSYGLGGRCL